MDTAPREAQGAAEAARLAELVLVPCRPSGVDVLAVSPTLRVVAPARAVVVLNGCPARGPWTAEAVEALAGTGADGVVNRRLAGRQLGQFLDPLLDPGAPRSEENPPWQHSPGHHDLDGESH